MIKNFLKTISIFISILIMAISFSACKSKEAKNVIDLINNIGEVNIDSKADIDLALEEYEKLSEEDKKSIKNIDTLYSAQKSFEKYVPEYIENQIHHFRFDDFYSIDELKSFVNDYYDRLDEEQIEIVGSAIGKVQLEDMVVSLVKSNMKNPSSFELVDFDPGYVCCRDDGIYFSFIKMTYRGTNSFGGVVPESLSGSIDFTVNFDNCTITYKDSLFL